MKNWITKFMTECVNAKSKPFSGNDFGNFVRNNIPQVLFNTGLIDKDHYKIKASVGQGSWADIFWVVIYDTRITTTIRKGVYIAYLLAKDGERLYLTLNEGCEDILAVNSKETTIEILNNHAREIRKKIPSGIFMTNNTINLGKDLSQRGQLYQEGTIFFKEYKKDAIPSEEELHQDLLDMMNIYRQYAEHQTDDEWWPSLDEYNPGFTKDDWIKLLNNPEIVGPVWGNVLAKFYDIGGMASCKQIEEQYGDSASSIRSKCMHLARTIHQETNCPLMTRDNGDNSYWKILFVGRNAKKDEAGNYVWKLRPELYQALKEFNILRYLNRTGQFDSWTIKDDLTAIKQCDKSFFDYNGSGVPRGICWFFEATNLELGQVKEWELLYQGKRYTFQVRNESSDRRRVRIFWKSELGRLLDEYRNKANVTATFRRVGDHTYELTMKGDEAVLNVREKLAIIREYIEAKGFAYDGGLIENLYLSLKSKPFVILAGTSGTGKTRLVRLFAEAIGATKENGRYEQIAVRPDWSDSTDLFGHVDLNGKFVPGKILEFLAHAQKDKNKPYILCLDEMNLARVEYYLSDFLSVIETRDMKDGGIITDALVSENDYGLDTEKREQFGEIRFPENLYIVGTVNMDETTFPFSKKVLDRANTIEFNYVDLNATWNDIAEEAKQLDEDNSFLRSEYLKLIECPETWHEKVTTISAELEKYNQILKKANAHIGYRVRDEIVFYLLNNLESGILGENDALDNEILQKILPRIQGSSASIKSMLCELFKEVAGNYEEYQTESNDTAERMLELLQKSDHVKYRKSAEKIAFMVRRFEEDGFTSYWL